MLNHFFNPMRFNLSHTLDGYFDVDQHFEKTAILCHV